LNFDRRIFPALSVLHPKTHSRESGQLRQHLTTVPFV
jgi:hypothetical protein